MNFSGAPVSKTMLTKFSPVAFLSLLPGTLADGTHSETHPQWAVSPVGAPTHRRTAAESGASCVNAGGPAPGPP